MAVDRARFIERGFPLKQASLFLPLPIGRGRAEGAGEGPQ